MQTIFYSKRFITGKILNVSKVHYNMENIIVYINSNNYFHINRFNKLPKCVLIDESSLFSHLVSFCISNEIPIALVTKDEIKNNINKMITIDFQKSEIITSKNFEDININPNKDELNIVKTKDGTEICLYATVKNFKNAVTAQNLGIKSAGLISTEFFNAIEYTSANHFIKSLKEICENFKEGNISIRLFDYDENKSYFYIDAHIERGIRAYEFDIIKQIIDLQIESCIELSQKYNVEIVIPFVTNVKDIICIKEKLKQSKSYIPICAMIENPSAFLSVLELSKHVDSFSIGTNDLLQYFFAFDRDSINSNINYINPYSKSLINFLKLYPNDLINKTRVCGQLPIYPYMLQVLIQLGFRKFSIPSPMIPLIAEKIKCISLDKSFCQNINSLLDDDEIKEYITKTMIK